MERSDVTGSRKWALLGLAALLLLLLAVAVASTGSVPSGSGGTRRLSEQFVDALLSLYLLLMIAGIGLWAYVFLAGRDVVVRGLAVRRTRSPWYSVALLVIVFVVLGIVARSLSVGDGLRGRFGFRGGSAPGTTGSAAPRQPGEYRPEFATWPVLVVLAVLAVALVAWYLSVRARRRRLEPAAESLLPTLGDVLDETLDDLRAETDPRRAVIAAYARMERALGAYGLPRSPSEAPDEYLHRIFADLTGSRRASSRLTALFAWAKFSGHDVAPEMRQEAIEALAAVREELRAAEILAEERRLQALAELGQEAGG
jgi:hypothetical protein